LESLAGSLNPDKEFLFPKLKPGPKFVFPRDEILFSVTMPSFSLTVSDPLLSCLVSSPKPIPNLLDSIGLFSLIETGLTTDSFEDSLVPFISGPSFDINPKLTPSFSLTVPDSLISCLFSKPKVFLDPIAPLISFMGLGFIMSFPFDTVFSSKISITPLLSFVGISPFVKILSSFFF